MLIRTLFALLLLIAQVRAEEVPAACAPHLPFGLPTLKIAAATTLVCHVGYAALHDDDLLIPRWVAYRLTAENTLGCNRRANNFHAEESLPAGRRATPRDYAGSRYDKGHQAPAADFAWNDEALSDSFSMVNMAPQHPKLNRQQWERLEETVRVWAYARSELLVYVGPILAARPKTIGKNHVAVPMAFWKVALDLETREAIAFQMPQKAIRKGPLRPWQASVRTVETNALLTLPLPDDTNREERSQLWPADVKAWNRARREACL